MATTTDIDMHAYVDEVRALMDRFSLPLESVEVVPDIQQWCNGRGVPEESPFRIAKIVRNTQTGQFVILFVERITAEMASSLIGAMELRGFASEVGALTNPHAFVRHLTLHEIAHGLDDSRSEEACDRWAFEQLRTLPINPTPHADARQAAHEIQASVTRAGGRGR